ncbi:MAG: hypothetical protein PF961_18910 [Planctomycetota bacterium]|nr:hypothetical protein [Planctomycetota bacterium]
MLRWRYVVVMWLIGGALTAYGVMVEIQVRAAVGSGLYRLMAKMTSQEQIDHYRWLSQSFVVIGPLIIVGAFLLRRNWDRIREGLWLKAQADRLRGRADRLRKRSKQLKRSNATKAQKVTRQAEKLEHKSARLSEKALRKLGERGNDQA